MPFRSSFEAAFFCAVRHGKGEERRSKRTANGERSAARSEVVGVRARTKKNKTRKNAPNLVSAESPPRPEVWRYSAEARRRGSDHARSRGGRRRARGFAPDDHARTRLGCANGASVPRARVTRARVRRARRPRATRARTAPRTPLATASTCDETRGRGSAGEGARREAAQRAAFAARPSRRYPKPQLDARAAQRPRFPSRAPPLARSGAHERSASHGKKHSPGPYESNCRARVGYGAMRDVSRAYLDEPEQRVDVIVAVAGVLLLGFPRGRSRGGLLRGSPPLRDRDRGQGALLVAGIFVLHSRRGRTRGVRVRVRADVRRDRARTGVTGVGRPLGGSVARLVRASCSARGDASETKKRAFRGRRRPFSLWRLCVTPSVLERSSDRAPTRGREQTKCSYGTRLRFFGRCREHVARFFSGSPIRSPRSLVRLVRDSRRARQRPDRHSWASARVAPLFVEKNRNPDRARSRVSLGRGTMASMPSAAPPTRCAAQGTRAAGVEAPRPPPRRVRASSSRR